MKLSAAIKNTIREGLIGVSPWYIFAANLDHALKDLDTPDLREKDAIVFHRDNIRKKLGLSGKETNLRTFLLTLSKKQLNDEFRCSSNSAK